MESGSQAHTAEDGTQPLSNGALENGNGPHVSKNAKLSANEKRRQRKKQKKTEKQTDRQGLLH